MKAMDQRTAESLCEKSMKVVGNVIKLSAFSIAQRSLGTTSVDQNSVPSRNFQPTTTSSFVVANKPMMMVQKPKTNLKQTYLVEPDHGTYIHESSSYVFQEDMNVDGRASDFIRKVHEKNHKDHFVSSETSELSYSYKQLPRTRVVK